MAASEGWGSDLRGVTAGSLCGFCPSKPCPIGYPVRDSIDKGIFGYSDIMPTPFPSELPLPASCSGVTSGAKGFVLKKYPLGRKSCIMSISQSEGMGTSDRLREKAPGPCSH